MDFKKYELACHGINNGKYLLKYYGKKEYYYYDFDYDNNVLYKYNDIVATSEDELLRIREVIDNFNKELDYIHKNYTLAYLDRIDLKIYYRRNEDNIWYDYVSEYKGEIIKSHTIFFYHVYPFYKKYDISKEDYDYYEDLNNNPIYLSAKESNDRLIELRLKDLYSYITDSEVKEIEEITKTKYLKRLDEAFNNSYVIFNPNDDDYNILKYSCYVILHRPYFGMMDHTHDYYGLNPHTKFGVDATKKDEKPITFMEFLKIYEKENNKNIKLSQH